MRLILDTHILLWTLAGSRSLPHRARDLLLDPLNEKYASVVSLWEIAIKYRLRRTGPDTMPFDARKAYELIGLAALNLLPVTASHAIAVDGLPQERHADPFDRFLIAQAIAEAMHLLTHDAALAAYGDAVIPV